MKETRKEKVWMIIGVITLLIFGIGATFAYFIAEGGNAEQTNINVITHTTDSLVFEVGKPISITADQTTFAPGAGNRTANTFARAELKANSSTNNATEHYYVYLSIDTNEFTYSTEEKTAELILTITDPNGNPLTSINGLNYVTVGEISGFDITESNGLITIANNYEITSTSTKIDEWNIELTLVNLDANQNNNAGKTFNASLKIQKEKSNNFAYYVKELFTTQGTNNLYHHDGTITDSEGNILDAEDDSYRYAGGDYTIAPEYQETYKKISSKSVTDTEYIIGFICNGEESYVGNYCNSNKNYYYLKYEESEAKTQYVTYKEALAKTIEDGYLLETPVKNYVCFGSDEENCPTDNLYRIIGVFNGKVKLIKKTEIGVYPWDENFELNWSVATLNTQILNGSYLNQLGEEWSNKIKYFKWTVEGTTAWMLEDFYPKTIFKNEILNIETGDFGNGEKTFNSKIGLMYASDYGYASTPNNWQESLITNYNNINENWLHLGLGEGWEWTITRETYNYGEAILILDNGPIFCIGTYTEALVKPSFYLESSVMYVDGTGTPTDPYRIN